MEGEWEGIMGRRASKKTRGEKAVMRCERGTAKEKKKTHREIRRKEAERRRVNT